MPTLRFRPLSVCLQSANSAYTCRHGLLDTTTPRSAGDQLSGASEGPPGRASVEVASKDSVRGSMCLSELETSACPF